LKNGIQLSELLHARVEWLFLTHDVREINSTLSNKHANNQTTDITARYNHKLSHMDYALDLILIYSKSIT